MFSGLDCFLHSVLDVSNFLCCLLGYQKSPHCKSSGENTKTPALASHEVECIHEVVCTSHTCEKVRHEQDGRHVQRVPRKETQSWVCSYQTRRENNYIEKQSKINGLFSTTELCRAPEGTSRELRLGILERQYVQELRFLAKMIV